MFLADVASLQRLGAVLVTECFRNISLAARGNACRSRAIARNTSATSIGIFFGTRSRFERAHLKYSSLFRASVCMCVRGKEEPRETLIYTSRVIEECQKREK